MPRIFDNIELGLLPTLRETLEVANRSSVGRDEPPQTGSEEAGWRRRSPGGDL